MKKSKVVAVLLTLSSVFLLSYDLPKGWFKAGSEPDKYDMGVDVGAGKDGKNAAIIKSNSKKIRGFGTLMQNCLPDKYKGKRIKMSGYLKSSNVDGWAGFWLRIDGKDRSNSLGFDNMYDRKITGTTEWKNYEIILDVPEEAVNIAYGALLGGTGTIWFDGLKFDVVESTINPTGKKLAVPKAPENLNFED